MGFFENGLFIAGADIRFESGMVVARPRADQAATASGKILSQRSFNFQV
jgi:hypothetical protein